LALCSLATVLLYSVPIAGSLGALVELGVVIAVECKPWT